VRRHPIRKSPRSLVSVVLLALAGSACAHGGGLDANGCHRDRSVGNYHCHRGPHAGETFPSKAAYPGGAAGSDASPDEGYHRQDYLPRWADADGDCQDTRQEVLIAESLAPVTLDASGCHVVSGRWRDPYTGRSFTHPSRLDIDHLVPLREAHVSGAAAWPTARKRRYANDLRHPETLIAVDAGANRSKGARDPAGWLPPDRAYRCEYVSSWLRVKYQWHLDSDARERAAIRRVLAGCG